MRKMIAAGFVAALLLTSAVNAQEARQPVDDDGRPQYELSLFDAVEMTLRYNLQVRLNKLSPDSAYERISSNRAPFDPTITFNVPSQFGSRTTQGTSQLDGGDVVTSRNTNGGFTFSHRLQYGTNWSIGWTAGRSSSSNTFSNFNPSYSSGLNLQFTQPLLRGFGTEVNTAQIVIARNDFEISEEQFRQQVWNTVQQVYSAYWQLVYEEASLETQVLALDLARQQFNRNKIQVEIGTLAPIETVQAEQQVASAELTVTRARQSLANAEDELKRLINFTAATPNGWDVNLVPTDTPEVNITEVDVEAAVQTALDNDPQLRQEALRLNSQALSIKLARDALLPQVNLTGNLQLSGTGGDLIIRGSGFGTSVIDEVQEGGFSDALRNMMSGDFRNWSVGLSVQFPINNWAAKAQQAQAVIAERQIITRVADREQQLRVDVVRAARQVTSGARQVEQARTAYELAQRQLNAEERKFAVGTTTNFEVLRFQRDLALARTSELQAIRDYVNSLAALEQLKGTLLQSLGVSFGIAGVPTARR